MTDVIHRRPRPHLANGDQIKSLRLRLGGFTQEQLAKTAGISRRYFIQLETGEKLPSGEVRDRIALALGCDASEIASSDDEDEQDAVEALTRALRLLVREEVARKVVHA